MACSNSSNWGLDAANKCWKHAEIIPTWDKRIEQTDFAATAASHVRRVVFLEDQTKKYESNESYLKLASH